ncbi:hypothetical protein BGZ57DRAFT_441076 [Hyaloscypha finlandica]|nr:hypothetical protein BGZ57DRAFT_441076 [Hyaloscypha finlandica]
MSRVKLDNANASSLNVQTGYCTFTVCSLWIFSDILEYQFLPLWSSGECPYLLPWLIGSMTRAFFRLWN